MSKKAVIVLSGGIDSVTMAYDLYAQGYDLHMVHFYYGQKQGEQEICCATLCAEVLDAEFTVIDLAAAGLVLGGSALTSDIPIPHVHYESPEAKSTVVPNRNAIMLAIAYGIAVTEKANLVGIGVQGGDHAVYPDCRPAFIKAFSLMEKLATGNPIIELYVPFLHKSKAEVIQFGLGLCVPFEDTWTCYEGGEKACGLCPSCVERLEAFASVGIKDPLEYSIQ